MVVGAGPAGLAVAARLHVAGVPAVVVERASEVGASWRARYDRLRLNTSRWFSYLPGQRFTRDAGKFPSRDDFVAYLERYAGRHQRDLMLETEVHRIERIDGSWCLETSRGELHGESVVIATGYDRAPSAPDWPGRGSFVGELVHASAYRNAAPYRGRNALVVGPGSTGVEIAADLVYGGAKRVRLAVRTPPHIMLRSVSGVPTDLTGVLTRALPTSFIDRAAALSRRLTVGDLSPYGLPTPDDGVASRFLRTGQGPTVVDRDVVNLVKDGRIEVVPAVDGFEGEEVLLAGGERIRPDAVIAATGYRRGLEALVGHLGVLGADGLPSAHGPATHSGARALHFVGFTRSLGGNLREIRLEAKRTARAIAASAKAA